MIEADDLNRRHYELEARAIQISSQFFEVATPFIQDVISLGRDLLATKAKIGHGNWKAWCEENLLLSARTIQAYCQLAKSARLANAQSTADLADLGINSLADALSFVANPKADQIELFEPTKSSQSWLSSLTERFNRRAQREDWTDRAKAELQLLAEQINDLCEKNGIRIPVRVSAIPPR